MHSLKLTHSNNSHQYKKVPLNPESDSEDDEAILYAAPSLNEHTNDRENFGMGVYDHGRDLDLPQVRKLPNKRDLEIQKRYMYVKQFFKIFLLLVVMTVCVVVVSLFIAAVNLGYFDSSSSSTLTPAPTCVPVPKPLADAEVQPCGGDGGAGGVATTVVAPTTAASSGTAGSKPPPPDTTHPPVIPHTIPSDAPTEAETEPETLPLSHTDAPTEAETLPTHSHTLPPDAPTEAKVEPETLPTYSAHSVVPHTVPSTAPTEAKTETSAPPPTTHPSVEGAETTKPSSGDAKDHTSTPADKSPIPSATGGGKNEVVHADNPLPSATPTFPEASCYPVPKPIHDQRIIPCPTASEQATVLPTPPHVATPPPSTTEFREVKGHGTGEHGGTDIVTPTQDGDKEAEITPPSEKATPLFWDRELQHTMTETSPELYDANGDGFDDVIVAVDLSQCSGKVIALNSLDGTTIWEQGVKFAAFAVRCILDVNGDGAPDCLVSGRSAGFVALSGADGALLWSVDPAIVFGTYNFYFPLVLPDMDDDGVDDIINVHGGDPKYEPTEHDRSPAFLVAVSGRTGQKLMEPVPMPDGRESYMSPILFTVNRSDFVLFGSGGETVAGSLWAVELNSLRMRVALYHTHFVTSGKKYWANTRTVDVCLVNPEALEQARPVFNGRQYNLNHTMESTPIGHFKCPLVAHKLGLWNDFNLCLYEVVRGVNKGVVLPPVIVDMTLDGVEDLVVSMYDGGTLVMDGKDLATVVWETSYPGTESYSLPAPLYYTSDDIPDLVIRTNAGAWPDYETSVIRVLDGADGSLLWTFNSTHNGMMSAVSVLAKTHGRDALAFLAIGIPSGDAPREEPIRDKREVGPREWVESVTAGGDGILVAQENTGDGEGGRVLRHSHTGEPVMLDPFDLWVSTPDDPVPDPGDIAAVLEYCGMQKEDYITSFYMINREMVESGMDVVPLASYEPLIFLRNTTNISVHDAAFLDHPPEQDPAHSPTHSARKRHEHDDAEELGEAEEDENDIHEDVEAEMSPMGLRCSHVTKPTAIYTTPLLADFDHDGRLDVVYLIVWTSGYDIQSFKTLVVTSDLEKLFVHGYGTEILDFDIFLPSPKQPWTRYMGRKGNSVFEHDNT